MDIPIYRFLIDENEDEVGMVGISLVENPAFQSKFVAFNKDVKPIKFVEDKKYKQVLTGLAIIPDKLIYRYDNELGEYYGYFSAEEIEKIRNKFHRQHFTSNVNTDHNDKNVVDAAFVFFKPRDDFVHARTRVLHLFGIIYAHALPACSVQ